MCRSVVAFISLFTEFLNAVNARMSVDYEPTGFKLAIISCHCYHLSVDLHNCEPRLNWKTVDCYTRMFTVRSVAG